MITKIETHIRAYEVDGAPVALNKTDAVVVSAHRIQKDFVVLDWHGSAITVAASDLEKAIRNATNHD